MRAEEVEVWESLGRAIRACASVFDRLAVALGLVAFAQWVAS